MRGSASPPTLAGRRIRLRPYAAGFSEDELRSLYDWARDEELAALTGGLPLDMPYARFRERFLEQLQRIDSRGERIYAILNRNGSLLGRIGLFGIDAEQESAELGVMIGPREARGRGFGREAVGLIVDHAFDAMGLRSIRLTTYPENRRARRAFAAAGFRETRRLRRFTLDRGTHDEIEMELLPADRSSAAAGFRGARTGRARE